MKTNKKRLNEQLDTLVNEGIELYGKDRLFPSKKSVKVAKTIIKFTNDEELNNWNIYLLMNGTILFNYNGHNGIAASVNAADLGVSGFFSYLDVYETRSLKVPEAEQIVEIFKMTNNK